MQAVESATKTNKQESNSWSDKKIEDAEYVDINRSKNTPNSGDE
jgi:hypothetical protein